MAYGTIVTHLHDREDIAPVKVEGINRHSWQYLVVWGIGGVVMGSLLPWIDVAWNRYTQPLQPEHGQARFQRSPTFGSDKEHEGRSSGRFDNGLGADWNPVVRSIGAFVGIAFAIVSLSPHFRLHSLTPAPEETPVAINVAGVSDTGLSQPCTLVFDRPFQDRICLVGECGHPRHDHSSWN